MKRLVAREIAVQILYGSELIGQDPKEFADSLINEQRFSDLKCESDLFAEYPDENSLMYIYSIIDNYILHKDIIDELISENSKGWKINRISKTALAVMRVAIIEIMYIEDVPVAVAINSAVEIDKGYDVEETVSFVNGVLGSVVKKK